jgi:hypothetical protein
LSYAKTVSCIVIGKEIEKKSCCKNGVLMKLGMALFLKEMLQEGSIN